MKCIHCNSDTTHRVRSSNRGRCGSCKHPFAFEPRTDTLKVTDGLFVRAVKDVSGDNAAFFTETQLWYEFNRRLLRKKVPISPGATLIGVSGVGGVLAVVIAHAFWPLAVITVPGVIGGIVLYARAKKAGPVLPHPQISAREFHRKYLMRWGAIHGAIPKLLPPLAPSTTPAPAPPDVAAFSFDRALITDHAAVAALLVANNFHFENNCAILSADGYPQHAAATILTMLRRNPRLRVFALHDASEAGCGLPLTLRGPNWFPDPAVQVMDLGLRPSHVLKMRPISLPGGSRTLPPALHATLAPEEAAWLERGDSVELEAVRPAKLMRSVFQGFARADQADTLGDSGGGGIIIWDFDGGADIQSADSFG